MTDEQFEKLTNLHARMVAAWFRNDQYEVSKLLDEGERMGIATYKITNNGIEWAYK